MTATSYPKGVAAIMKGVAAFKSAPIEIEFQPTASLMVVSAGGAALVWAEATQEEVEDAAAHLPDTTRLQSILARAGLTFSR